MDGFLLCLQDANGVQQWRTSESEAGGARNVQGRRLIPSLAAKRTPFPYAKVDTFEVM